MAEEGAEPPAEEPPVISTPNSQLCCSSILLLLGDRLEDEALSDDRMGVQVVLSEEMVAKGLKGLAKTVSDRILSPSISFPQPLPSEQLAVGPPDLHSIRAEVFRGHGIGK